VGVEVNLLLDILPVVAVGVEVNLLLDILPVVAVGVEVNLLLDILPVVAVGVEVNLLLDILPVVAKIKIGINSCACATFIIIGPEAIVATINILKLTEIKLVALFMISLVNVIGI
jgi:hypothetical protein